MTYEEFVDLVARCRIAQREYVRTCSFSAEEYAKRLEKQVDEAVVQFKDGQQKMSFE
jgi:pyruvate-formate lyase-activating enzyme